MRRPSPRRLFAALALMCLPVAGHSQNGTGIYMGQGLVLRAAPPHQLTLNAHVSEFAYQPGGDSIAYVSTRDDDDTRTVTIKFVDTHQKDPDTRTLYTATLDFPDAQTSAIQFPLLNLLGWSADGRYLLFKQQNVAVLQEQCFCEDVGSDTPQAHSIPLPAINATSIIEVAWSPSHHRILLTTNGYTSMGYSVPVAAQIYDPAHDQVQPVAIPDGLNVWGWLDEGRLLLICHTGPQLAKINYLSYDLASGKDTEIARPTPWPPAQGSRAGAWEQYPADTNPKVPGLTLETQPQTLKDAQGVAEVQASALWVRRAKAAKAMSALAVGVTPGRDDPLAQWSPEGDAVAFIAHEDLFVADLTEQEATPREKVAAGETLGCDEERQIVESNLKQIGLGIIQYTQDNDENLPTAAGWHDAIFAYVKDESLFNFAGIRPIYHAPADLALSAMDDPAHYVMVTADTPCAHIVLYGDGHVKSFDHSGNRIPSSEETH